MFSQNSYNFYRFFDYLLRLNYLLENLISTKQTILFVRITSCLDRSYCQYENEKQNIYQINWLLILPK